MLNLTTFYYFYLNSFKNYIYNKFNKTRLGGWFETNSSDISNWTLVAGYLLIFYKMLFYLFFMKYSPSYLNIILLLIFVYLAYKNNLILIIKKWFFLNIFSKLVSEYSPSRAYFDEEIHNIDDLIPEFKAHFRKPNKELIFQKIWTYFILLRLFVLSEPYLFIFLRFILFYCLLFNNFYFLTLILTFIGLTSHFLFHFSDYNSDCLKYFYKHLARCTDYYSRNPSHIEELRLFKRDYPLVENPSIQAETDHVLKPIYKNAEIMYYWSIRHYAKNENYWLEIEYWDEFEHMYNKRGQRNYFINKRDNEHLQKYNNINQYTPSLDIHNAIAYDMRTQLEHNQKKNINDFNYIPISLLVLQGKKNILGNLFLLIVISLIILYSLFSENNFTEINSEEFSAKDIIIKTIKKEQEVIGRVAIKGKVTNQNKNEIIINPPDRYTTFLSSRERASLSLKKDNYSHPVSIEKDKTSFKVQQLTTFNKNKSLEEEFKLPIYYDDNQGIIQSVVAKKMVFLQGCEEFELLEKIIKDKARQIDTGDHLEKLHLQGEASSIEVNVSFLQKLKLNRNLDSFFKFREENERHISPGLDSHYLLRLNQLKNSLYDDKTSKEYLRLFIIEYCKYIETQTDAFFIEKELALKMITRLEKISFAKIDKELNLSKDNLITKEINEEMITNKKINNSSTNYYSKYPKLPLQQSLILENSKGEEMIVDVITVKENSNYKTGDKILTEKNGKKENYLWQEENVYEMMLKISNREKAKLVTHQKQSNIIVDNKKYAEEKSANINSNQNEIENNIN